MAAAALPFDARPVVPAAVHPSRRFFDRRAAPLYALMAVEIAIMTLAVASGRFTADAGTFTGVGRDAVLILCLAFALRRLGQAGIATMIEWLVLSLATSYLGAFVSVVLASSDLPLADGWLARADAWLGLDRAALLAPIHARPGLMRAAIGIYNVLGITPPLLAAVLLIHGRSDRAWTLLIAMTAALVVSIAIMPLVPAYGAQNLSFNAEPVFTAVRDGSLRRLDDSVVTGLVVFPSLHAADAVILGWAALRFGGWAIPFVLLHVAMFATALIVGGHYGIDLLAGTAVAVASIRAALWLERRRPNAHANQSQLKFWRPVD